MDAVKNGFVRALLGQTVIALSHVELYTHDSHGAERFLLTDTSTLVFSLANGRRFELVEAQQADLGVVAFTEAPTDDTLLTSGELERTPDEYARLVAVEEMDAHLPWTVSSITEVWQPYQDPPFLIATILWDDALHPLLPL